MEPDLADEIAALLGRCGDAVRLGSLSGTWVKQAAQGAAVIADGLAGGQYAALVERLQLRAAASSVLDWLHHPRSADVRGLFTP